MYRTLSAPAPAPWNRYARPRLRRRRYLGTTAQAATTGATGVGTAVTGAAIVGTSIATAALTAGIGAGVGIILALFAAHKARVAGAKNENAAVGILVPQAQQELQQIAQLYTTGQITQAEALQYTPQVLTNFQQGIAPYQTGPGQHTMACSSSGSTPCNKSCTAGCCVFCNNIQQWVAAALAAIQAGSGTAQMNQVYGSPQYGYSGQAAWSLTFTAPAPGTVAGVSSELGTLATDVTSGTVGGVPVFLIIAALAAGAYYAFG